MPENLMGGQGATLLMAIVIVGIALLALVGVFWLIRNRAASTFIRGGKNRLPRLAVLDATAVDTRRRLVLIRRDDVEHLVMIGGPTDIVIESRISPAQHARATRHTEQAAPAQAQQHVVQPAANARKAPPQPRAPAKAEPPAQPEPMKPSSGQLDSRTQPSPRQQHPAQTAAPAATIATAATLQTNAADVLETARTRVFEEPGYRDNELEDMTAVPQPAPRPAQQSDELSPPASRPEQLTSARDQRTTSAAQNPIQTAANETDPLQSEAADVLETVRSRMFEEPTFDEAAFDELTTKAGPGNRAGSEANSPQFSRATLAGAPQTPSAETAAAAEPSDFEAVLAAELSEDPTLGTPQQDFISAHYNEHKLGTDEETPLQAPEVKPEPQPDRESLEAEMEKLLGDLSRKP